MLIQKQSSKVINGIQTEVVLQPFADRILILITQLGKVGNLVRWRKLLTAKTNTDLCVKDTSINTANSTPTGTTIPRHAGTQHLRTASPSTFDTIDDTARECTHRPPANTVYTVRVASRHDDLDRGGGWVNGRA